jgi:hypothetical protein
MLLSNRTCTPKKERATSHGTCKLHYSTPYEVESDTLIFGYRPLPGKSRVVTDRHPFAVRAKLTSAGQNLSNTSRRGLRARQQFHATEFPVETVGRSAIDPSSRAKCQSPQPRHSKLGCSHRTRGLLGAGNNQLLPIAHDPAPRSRIKAYRFPVIQLAPPRARFPDSG